MLAWWLILGELGVARSRAAPIPKFLQGVTLERSPRWPCLLTSAVLHAAMLVVLPVLGDWLAATRPEVWVRRYHLFPSVEIRVPERLYLATTPVARPKAARARPRPTRRIARRSHAQAPGEAPARTAAGRRRRFELPRLRPRQTEQTLLQPDFPADMPVLARISLPDLLFWSPLPNHPAFRIRKPFVTPGAAEPFAQPPAFEAPPRLTAPNWEALASELQAASARAASPESLLLPAISLPIRLPELLTRPPQTYISTERSVGDPLSVLALNWRLRPIREDLIIPAGNQLAEAESAAGSGVNRPGEPTRSGSQDSQSPGADAPRQSGATAATQAPAQAPVTPAAAPNVQSSANPAADSPTQGTAAQADERAASQPGATSERDPRPATGSPAATARVALGTNPVAGASREAPQTPPAAPPQAVVRIEHPPGGMADVVVVQPAPMDGTLETVGALSGRPVYSVYLQVGASRQWILQYCVPGEDQSTIVTGGVVRLASHGPLSAPYPRVTYLPPVRSRPGAYLLIHGYISATGRFESLEPLRASDREEAAIVVPVLERWEFRPAMRDGQPVRIEILLAIPRG